MTSAPQAHYIITGESNGCEPYTPETHGTQSLLRAGEDALEVSLDTDKFGIECPSIFVLSNGAFVNVTAAAAALVFEKWLADDDGEDSVPSWLQENCDAASDEQNARYFASYGADHAYDLSREVA